MAKIKLVNNQTNIVADEDGVVTSYDNIQTHVFRVESKEFAFIYRKCVTAFTGLSSTDICVFISISFGIDSKEHVFASTKGRAKSISDELKITEQSVFNSINKLHKKGFLVRNPYCKNEYYINPEYAWKGKQDEREKVFKLVLIEDLKKRNPDAIHNVKVIM